MILEAVMLNVKSGMEQEYETAFRKASSIISSMKTLDQVLFESYFAKFIQFIYNNL